LIFDFGIVPTFEKQNKKYNTVGTIPKYNTVGIIPKYNTVGTIPKYNTVGTIPKYNTVGTIPIRPVDPPMPSFIFSFHTLLNLLSS
jgi:hypothetical protein